MQHKVVKTFVKTVVLVDPEVDTVPKGRGGSRLVMKAVWLIRWNSKMIGLRRMLLPAIEKAFIQVLAPSFSPK